MGGVVMHWRETHRKTRFLVAGLVASLSPSALDRYCTATTYLPLDHMQTEHVGSRGDFRASVNFWCHVVHGSNLPFVTRARNSSKCFDTLLNKRWLTTKIRCSKQDAPEISSTHRTFGSQQSEGSGKKDWKAFEHECRGQINISIKQTEQASGTRTHRRSPNTVG